MNRFKQLSKKGYHFVLLTLALSTIPYFFIVNEGDTGSNWTMMLMWVPAIAAVIMRLIHKEGLFKSTSWNPTKHFGWILVAAFIPFTIEILTIFLSVVTGAASLKENFISIESGMISLRGTALLFGAAEQPWYSFIPNYFLSYFVGVLFYSVAFALGEEFGWRGYLQREWASTNTLFPFLFIGAIWGWWHLPGILLGHNYPDYPILGALVLMPIVTSLFSIVFGLSFNKTRVIWLPVVFHGSVNISAEISNTGLVQETMNRPLNDFIWTSLWLIAAILFWPMRDDKS